MNGYREVSGRFLILGSFFLYWCAGCDCCFAGESGSEALQAAQQALSAGDRDRALKILGTAIKGQPENISLLVARAGLYAHARDFDNALADYDRAIEKQPTESRLYYWRGRTRFCLGKIKESVADFDRYLVGNPGRKAEQWERGIALYYAGQFKKGTEQFSSYQKFDNTDVENAVWCYLCTARDQGVEKARKGLLPISGDLRVPMQEIYALYRGGAKVEDVLQAVEKGKVSPLQKNRRLFYANLYIGLYFESLGQSDAARKYLEKAVQHKIGHYMWDVANVHLKLLSNSGQQNGK